MYSLRTLLLFIYPALIILGLFCDHCILPGFVVGHGSVTVTETGGSRIVVLTSSVSFASLRREESSFTPLLVLFAKDPLRWALPR